MWLFFYNLFFLVGFIFFAPGLYWKYRNRPGWKATFAERFGRFAPERARELAAYRNCTWIHAVSVGETVVALSLIKIWRAKDPARKFVISTTTTTGQELARKQAPPDVAVIFCPIDFKPWVRRALDLVSPALLVIFETEIWPNLLVEARRRGVAAALVNARMSDRSCRGYRRARLFFAPLLECFGVIAAQSEADAGRFRAVSPRARVTVTGNIKFDQRVPADLPAADYDLFFGPGPFVVLVAASTHPGEEELIARTFQALKADFPALKLVLVPRHAERGAEIAALLEKMPFAFFRRSSGPAPAAPVEILLADTTGEMLKWMNGADLVFMGKSLAGHDEGHNLIEPALLDKPVVTGAVLRNFRFVLRILEEHDAVKTVAADGELEGALRGLLLDEAARCELGRRAGRAIREHAGAADRTIMELEKLQKTEKI